MRFMDNFINDSFQFDNWKVKSLSNKQYNISLVKGEDKIYFSILTNDTLVASGTVDKHIKYVINENKMEKDVEHMLNEIWPTLTEANLYRKFRL